MLTVNDLNGFLNGEIIGDGSRKVNGIAAPDIADEMKMTFAFNERDLEKIVNSKACCVLATVGKESYPKTILKVRDIKKGMTVAYNVLFRVATALQGEIHPSASIGKDIDLGSNVSIAVNTVVGEKCVFKDNVIIGPNCSIGENVFIGCNSIIHSNVSIYDNTRIGDGVIIHSGTVIGADGFGYIPEKDRILKVPQLGKVIIEDEVEIGANTCIDRGTFSNTVIGACTKIDNLTQIAHNVKIGRGCFIAAHTGIAGSVTIGNNVMMGGQVGVSDHVIIEDNVKVGAKAGVISPRIGKGSVLFGYPARDAKKAMKSVAFVDFLFKKSKKLKKILRQG